MDGLFSEMSHFAWREAMPSYMRRRWRGAGRLRAASFSGRAPRRFPREVRIDQQ